MRTSLKQPALACILAATLAACGSSGSSSAAGHGATTSATPPATSASTPSSTATAASATSSSASAATAKGCAKVAQPAPKGAQHLKAPTLRLDPKRTYTVHVVTNCGSFAFTLDVKAQPKTAASVYTLAKSGFYTGLTFHRVAAGFVIQGGDPLGTGAGGPGYTVVEAPPRGATYPEGTVAMAKTATQPSGASGSQFFVMSGSAGLPPQYAIAGKVVSGLATVLRIGGLATNPPQDGAPTMPVVMSKVTVSAS